ncbi:MAG: DedA family protein [Deltaproteobacteria bacterium]|jgi:membrane protein DedA with SNARE-associated domain|nr:MAG: DedA family protein [Deltaproteobacteria bacterium]
MVSKLAVLDILILFLATHSELFIYLALFSVLMIAGLGVPIPEDIALIAGGFLAYAGFSNLTVTVIVCFFGVILGDLVVFSLGRRWGDSITKHRHFVRLISEKKLNRAKKFFREHGSKTVFLARFILGFRVVAFTTAGILKMKASHFITINTIASIISVPIWVFIGYIFGANLDVVVKVVKRADFLIIISLSLAIGLTVAYYLWKKRKKSSL